MVPSLKTEAQSSCGKQSEVFAEPLLTVIVPSLIISMRERSVTLIVCFASELKFLVSY